MEKSEIRKQLPRVGDVRMEAPSGFKEQHYTPTAPQKCVVVGVNRAKLWYTVRFEKTGILECYKLPRVKTGPRGGIR